LAVWLLAKAQNSSCRKLNILGFLSEQALYLATLWGLAQSPFSSVVSGNEALVLQVLLLK
jgi:hypothetical protein